ncbi:hypothetical protein AB0L70_27270 [Kribbella sp. NPDC051952]|uniref:beta family protein n=1 Tax=Kribbella sp. NPDC051952 TaxID=3154851 RepID=UPI0034296AB8
MIAAGDFRALVALRSKQGELEALNTLHRDLGVQPLVVIEVEEDKSPEPTLDRVARTMRKLNALGRVAIADVNAIHSDAERFELLDKLANRLHSADDELPLDPIPFIPVARAGDAAWLYRLRAFADEFGCGCALRIEPESATPAQVAQLPQALGLEATDVDLIVDLGYVASSTSRVTDEAVATLADLIGQPTFRSITLLGGSVPRSLTQVAVWEQPRYEELVWRAAVSAGLAEVRFGDYGVVHPVTAPGIRRSNHVNVKYSCTDHWLYVREPIPVVDQQHLVSKAIGTASQSLLESGSFAGADYSWGDNGFVAAASGNASGYGSKTKVVALATSHHLSYLADLSAA